MLHRWRQIAPIAALARFRLARNDIALVMTDKPGWKAACTRCARQLSQNRFRLSRGTSAYLVWEPAYAIKSVRARRSVPSSRSLTGRISYR